MDKNKFITIITTKKEGEMKRPHSTWRTKHARREGAWARQERSNQRTLLDRLQEQIHIGCGNGKEAHRGAHAG